MNGVDDERQIDWHAIRERINTLGERLGRGCNRDDSAATAELRSRASQLAVRDKVETEPGTRLEVVEFSSGNERYAFELRYVSEIRMLGSLTAIPGIPEYIRGLVGLRGRAVPVVDLGQFFGLERRDLSRLNHVVVVADGDMETGVLADRVMGVNTVAMASLNASLQGHDDRRQEFLIGVSATHQVVLDAARLISSERLRV